MKKLLSILAVSGIVATSAPTAVACSKTTDALKTLSTSSFSLKQGSTKPVDQIQTEIAKQAGTKVTVKDAVKGITVAASVVGSPTTDKVLAGNTYKITITVKGNKYFKDGTYTKNITVSKIDLTTTDMLKDLKAGDDLYKTVRGAIVAQSDGELTIDDIKASSDILVSIWDNNTKSEVQDGAKATVGHSYDVKIMINRSTTFNDTLKDGKLTWVSVTSPKVLAFDFDESKISFKLNDDLYTTVRNEIAAQSNGLITADAVKASKTILISIWDTSKPNTIVADGTKATFGSNYDVKISISKVTDVFKDFAWKTKSISTITKLDLNTKIDSTTPTIKKGDDLYNDVRAYIAGQSNGLLKDHQAVESNSNILIAIWDTTANTPVAKDVKAMPGHTYDIKVMITNDDTTFNKLDWTTVTMTVAKLNLDTTGMSFNDGDDLYSKVRDEIVAQSDGELTNDTVTKSKTISIAIWDTTTNTMVADKVKALAGHSYDVKINVDAKDNTFNKVDWKTVNVKVDKLTLDTTKMNLSSVKANDDLYAKVRDAIVAESNGELTNSNVKSSNDILISIWDSKAPNTVLADKTTAVAGDSYDVHIMITSKDTTFNALTWKTVSFQVAS